jgi:hypothetical protein
MWIIPIGSSKKIAVANHGIRRCGDKACCIEFGKIWLPWRAIDGGIDCPRPIGR